MLTQALTAMPQHAGSSSTKASPSPWQQPLLRADRDHLHAYDRFNGASSAPMPPPSSSAVRRAAYARRAGRTRRPRPRPSQRLPTTYISADPAEFRRMVHEVTGADDLPPPRPEAEAEDQLLLPCRHPVSAPVAAGTGAGAGAGTLLLPTLDTSAFLLGRDRTHSEAPPRGGSPAGLFQVENNTSASAGGNRGFPTLESWNLL